MHTITAELARGRVDSTFPRHELSLAECMELVALWERNDIDGLMGRARERCVHLMEKASSSCNPYFGPDERV